MIEIPAVLERCAGIDIGKRELAVAVITGPADQEGEVKTKAFGTTVPALEELRAWLVQEGCTSVAMESTGSYWIPVKNVLEGSLKIVLVCPKKHKPERGDKTDFRDARHLAHLHRHGLLNGSYLPNREIVELRDLTRRRKKLQSNLTAEKNRIQKVLEAANVKVGNIIGDVFGVSGQEMVSVLVAGQEVSVEQIADLSKGKLRKKIPELKEALARHQMNDHHRWLIQQSIDHAILLDQQMEALEIRIQEKLKPYQREYELLQTIPGIKEMAAASILAEIGPDMSHFPTSKHLCSWAGICPGNNRSAGKNKRGKIKKGSRFLLAALAQAGWGAGRRQDSIFRRRFYRWRGRLGEAKANLALAHSLLRVIYVLLKEGRPYREPDPNAMHELEHAKLVRHHTRRLEQLGASAATLAELVAQLLEPPELSPEEKLAESHAPHRFRKIRVVKVRQGALGFRARPAHKKEYSVVTDPSAGGLPRAQPKHNTTKTKTKTKKSK